jgi:hypothetical protein
MDLKRGWGHPRYNLPRRTHKFSRNARNPAFSAAII